MAHLGKVQWEVDRGLCVAQGVQTYLEGNVESFKGFKPHSNVHFRSLWRKGEEWIRENETEGDVDWESSAAVQVRGDESLSQVAASKISGGAIT